jgi:hypothetical protein
MRRLNIAMLSAQEMQTEANVTDIVQERSELEMVGDQAEDAMVEANQIETEINQAQNAIDDTEEVLQEVEEERQVLVQSQQNGGMDKPAMEALQRAFARFEKRTGVSCAIRSMGLEGFSSKSTRAHSTSVALEGAKEYVKKIVDALMTSLKAVMAHVVAFAQALLKSTDKLEERANSVVRAAESAEGKVAPANSKVKNATVLEFTNLANKQVSGKAYVEAYAKQHQLTEYVYSFVSEAYKSGIENGTLNDLLIAFTKDVKEKEVEDVINKLTGTFTIKGAKYNNASPAGISSNGSDISESDKKQIMLGGYVISAEDYKKNVRYSDIIKFPSTFKAGCYKLTDAESTASDVPVLSVKESGELAKEVINRIKAYENHGGFVRSLDRALSNLVKKAQGLSAAEGVNTSGLSVGSSIVRSYVNGVINLTTTMQKYDVRLAKAALDYAAASIRAANGETQKA